MSMVSRFTTHTRVFLEHHLVHDLFQSLDDSKASLARQVEECKVFLEKPGSIWRKEYVGFGGWGLLQGQFHSLDELCVLRMVEQKVCKDKHIKGRIVGQMTRYDLGRCTPQITLMQISDGMREKEVASPLQQSSLA